MEHPCCRCVNGAGLVSLVLLSLGTGCVENLQQPAPAPALAALSMPTSWQRKFPGVLQAVTSWRSQQELMVQDTLVAKPSCEIQTHNSMQAGGKTDGRAAVAPHDQTQSISHFYPILTPPSVVGCCLATLHPCSTAALRCCCSPAAPPLHQAWAEPGSHVLPAACKHRYHLLFSACR